MRQPTSLLLTTAISLAACSGMPADCRQTSTACAQGYECRQAAEQWLCQPTDATAAAQPAPAPAPDAPKAPLSNAEREAITDEAKLNLRKLFDSSAQYYSYEFALRDGTRLPRQFPQSVSVTPETAPPCVNGRPIPYAANPATWTAPTWRALYFAIEGPQYYRYEYTSTGTGPDAAFTARAIGDLNCDGKLSVIEHIGSVDRPN